MNDPTPAFEDATIARLYPALSAEERRAVAETLERYVALALRVHARLERERAAMADLTSDALPPTMTNKE